MALRDQPYIPLYIQDFLTDEKLIECSAKATGVYVRLMCIMHKSEDYGKILLKQKDKQKDKQIENFAIKLGKQMPYSQQEIYEALTELVSEKVLTIDGDFLVQKRMVSDNLLSLKRADAGSKGGKFAQAKHKAKPKAKPKANTEYEYVIVNEDVIKDKSELVEKLLNDELYVHGLRNAHRGKDIKQAFEECYIHHSNAPNPPRSLGEWKQKLNTWLSNTKFNGKSNNKQQHTNSIKDTIRNTYGYSDKP